MNQSSSHCRALWAISFKLSHFLSQSLSLARAFWAYLHLIVAVCEPIFFQLSHFWASRPLIVGACELSLTHSGSLWLFLVVSSSLWFPLALTGSLCGPLWLTIALLFRIYSPWLTGPLLGSHRRCHDEALYPALPRVDILRGQRDRQLWKIWPIV